MRRFLPLLITIILTLSLCCQALADQLYEDFVIVVSYLAGADPVITSEAEPGGDAALMIGFDTVNNTIIAIGRNASGEAERSTWTAEPDILAAVLYVYCSNYDETAGILIGLATSSSDGYVWLQSAEDVAAIASALERMFTAE